MNRQFASWSPAAGRPPPKPCSVAVAPCAWLEGGPDLAGDGEKSYVDGKALQLYSIAMWVEGSTDELSRIAQVTYTLPRKYYSVQPEHVSTKAADGFRVTTNKVWGCVSTVDVLVKYKAGTKRQFRFDWCNASSWSARQL